MASMIGQLSSQILRHQKVQLFKSTQQGLADGEQKRDFVFVGDVVKVLIQFWERKLSRGLYNLGTGKAGSFNQLAHELFRFHEKRPVIEYFDMPQDMAPNYQNYTCSDNQRLLQELGEFSFKTLAEGIPLTLNKPLHKSSKNPDLVAD
jgi:ADP-L-glycero-D-manno-heptose 6-epimerase